MGFNSLAKSYVLVVLCVLVATAACGKKDEVTQKILSPFEQMEVEVFEALNSLRQDPQSHVAPLEQMLERFQGQFYTSPDGRRIITNEGAAAVQEAIDVLRPQKSLGTYVRNELLDKTARDHQRDQENSGETGHYSSPDKDGKRSSPSDRAKRYATYSALGENIAYGGYVHGVEVVYGLFVDDGVSDRGHRENMLYPDFREVGIACGPHPGYAKMCVINYGTNVRPK